MQEIGNGSSFCSLRRVTYKALNILGALSHDRLRVMVEVWAKGWVMWWFRRLRRRCEMGKMTYELSDLLEIERLG